MGNWSFYKQVLKINTLKTRKCIFLKFHRGDQNMWQFKSGRNFRWSLNNFQYASAFIGALLSSGHSVRAGVCAYMCVCVRIYAISNGDLILTLGRHKQRSYGCWGRTIVNKLFSHLLMTLVVTTVWQLLLLTVVCISCQLLTLVSICDCHLLARVDNALFKDKGAARREQILT